MDKEAVILISVLRHWECGLSGPCIYDSNAKTVHMNKSHIEWCVRAGKWLEKNNITLKDLNE